MDGHVLSLAENLSSRSSVDEIWEAVCEGLQLIGFGEVSWGYIDPKQDPPGGTAVRSTLPGWVWETYHNKRFYDRDPLLAHIVKSDSPFYDHYLWHDLNDLPPEQREAAGIYIEHLLPARFAVGERALGQTKIGILSLGANVGPDEWRNFVVEHMDSFTLAARMCAAYLAGAVPPALDRPLSAREAECLFLLAQGERNDRIAERLGLHRATVEMHIARARRKLGARTREQAIAMAVSAGAINL